IFTEALIEILEEGKVLAIDKSPHALYTNPQLAKPEPSSIIKVEILKADFNHPFDLPRLDGILMANALHYAKDPLQVLKNVLSSLNPDGLFILIEYDTDKPNPPWVPYPLSWDKFKK